ncbi:MAG: acetoacetate--CoA ligase [Ignavibacteriaceae bacterium]|nr:acetoacetate--CoA ligase [Ignavibacteriaceae bacterium]
MTQNQKPLWVPNEKTIKNSNMFKFMEYAGNQTGMVFSNYEELYSWSIDDFESFWLNLFNYADFIYEGEVKTVIDKLKMPGANWFEGIKLNYAENLLRFRADKPALISYREKNDRVVITQKQLFELSQKVASSLLKMGVKPGDRVAGYVANIPEAIIAMLATSTIGAVWSACSPDFGFEGVLDRFEQINPKVLFVSETYIYKGMMYDNSDNIMELIGNIPSIKKVIMIPDFYVFNNEEPEIVNSEDDMFLNFYEFVAFGDESAEFYRTDFDHPLFIMYSSGTTGKPKCMVHGQGGTLLQHFKELALHTDLKEHQKIFYYTTCGWMMWNWLVSSLQLGATVCIYDGSPSSPNLNVLWEMASKEKINIFGTSPKFLTACEKGGIKPSESFELSDLTVILSTGSPLSKENFSWVYKNFTPEVRLSSISGGTDIISCFILGNPLLPVYEGEIQCKGLGMAVEVYDNNAKPVVHEKGELVCTKPFPSMPIYFWNDKYGEKYFQSYFRKFPGVWHHGDYISVTPNKGVIVYGRSDATLNPGGVRIGTAEIYSVVESIDEVLDSLVTGFTHNNDVSIIMFVQLKTGLVLNDKLIKDIKDEIRTCRTPRHVPSAIFQVTGIPVTINGKKVELAVTKILAGEKIENEDAIANPEVLPEYVKIRKLLLK